MDQHATKNEFQSFCLIKCFAWWDNSWTCHRATNIAIESTTENEKTWWIPGAYAYKNNHWKTAEIQSRLRWTLNNAWPPKNIYNAIRGVRVYLLTWRQEPGPLHYSLKQCYFSIHRKGGALHSARGVRVYMLAWSHAPWNTMDLNNKHRWKFTFIRSIPNLVAWLLRLVRHHHESCFLQTPNIVGMRP